MNFEECLEEIINYENGQSKMNKTEFLKMIEEISEELTGAYKTRIRSLTFIENEEKQIKCLTEKNLNELPLIEKNVFDKIISIEKPINIEKPKNLFVLKNRFLLKKLHLLEKEIHF